MVKKAFDMLVNSNLQLSEHFDLKEFLRSDTADKQGLSNCPHTWKRFSVVLENLSNLCFYLEMLRSNFNQPIIITSGFRSPAVNVAVGGVFLSRHMLGAAADITACRFDELVDNVNHLFAGSQYIYYEINNAKRYIHVQLKKCLKDEKC